MPFSRRDILTMGCSAAAAPFLTPVTLAAAPWDQRLVVIILRGAMDGLDVVRPLGDPHFAAARRSLNNGVQGHDLDGFFALHPDLGGLMPLWRAGQLGFVQAVSTPYRDKRSHFDGQDLLEAGTGFEGGTSTIRDGWLNRMLQTLPGITAETAYAVGSGGMLLTSGAAPVASWAPDADLDLSPQARDLMKQVARGDPLFSGAVEGAIGIVESLEAEAGAAGGQRGQKPHVAIARFAAGRLRAESRIATFSINGWDTHNRQAAGMRQPLQALSDSLLTLRDELGPVWDRTAVVAMTEFGRTLRENGTGGTDHGTGGAMVLAGGAIRGGRVYGDWPGLDELDLYKGRDLMPTADVRAYAAMAMRGLFGLPRDVLERVVFPGVELAGVPEIIL
ncbi:DUF1501 domain-containing protein [Actibacterium sp. XHP0104]|uniref:DUF1501 domain-containing protein n=1 Tax=Actibacterium sp. XHP0104 TaxID=2984335 RepID=UPI0021E8FA4C|nr:DUF1501 domain-containing protein [Actibacterium sp. XHP0104]MCV2880460.1 DUF1501 domain-containing protein [Actibacterium sp. XHP0104]